MQILLLWRRILWASYKHSSRQVAVWRQTMKAYVTNHQMRGVLFTIVLLALADKVAFTETDGLPVRTSQVHIIIDSGDNSTEYYVANAVRDRILRRSQVTVNISEHMDNSTALNIHIGRRDTGSESFRELVERHQVTLPGKGRIAPESYAVKLVQSGGSPLLIAEGADKRGVLYAAGEVLRRLEYGYDWIGLQPVDMSAAPAYQFRGSSANQGGTMRERTGARAWTQEELRDYTLDYAFSGANAFYASGPDFDFVKQFDLMTVGGCRPNQFRGEIPEEWKAGGLEFWEGTGWVCPSVPEARAALMEQWDKEFSKTQNHDIMRMYAGDPGGCRCPRCEPWGRTFIELCEEVGAIWHKTHPDSIIQIANQDLSNEGDQAIFDYLNAEPRTWLEGIAYGPGSNAMSSYFREELRDDLFEYPGTGPVNRYLKEILNNIPKQQHITHYSDITHWISAQYMCEKPEPHLMKIYGRRTFHTRPAAFYSIFQSIMPFSEGDIIYSEGYHDEVHQYMWNRLLWNPNRTLEDILDEYCTYHFGHEAAPLMLQAMLQLEKNLEEPLADNPGIDRFYLLVKEAGWKIPLHYMADDYRWRLYMQKAALDKYYQLKLRRENECAASMEALVRNMASDVPAKTQTILAEPIETPEMVALRSEAGRLGDETNERIGLRNVGYFSFEVALTSLAWTRKQVEAALNAPEAEQAGLLQKAVLYEDPGPEGFYDDAGAPGCQPHLIQGNSYDASRRMDPENRPSANTIAYSLEEPGGVVFRYEALDPTATYKVRITMALPRYWQDTGQSPPDTPQKQNILADGEYIAKDTMIPVFTAAQFEYDVPAIATSDGILELSIEKGTGSRGVAVSEVWLIRK